MEFFQFAWGVLVPIMGFLINEHRKNKKRRIEIQEENEAGRQELHKRINELVTRMDKMQAYIELKVAVADERDRLTRERAND